MLNKRIIDGLDLCMSDASFVNNDPLATLETNILIGQIKYEVKDLKGQKRTKYFVTYYSNIHSCLILSRLLKHISMSGLTVFFVSYFNISKLLRTPDLLTVMLIKLLY